MCALRNSRQIDPNLLARSYRFDLKPCRTEPAVLCRTRTKLHHSLSLSNINNVNVSGNTGYTSRSDKDLDEFDEDYDFDAEDDLDTTGRMSTNEDVWLKTYLLMCKKLKRLPLQNVKRGTKSKKIIIKFTKLQINDLTALSIAIKRSYFINELDFENNDIGPAGAELIAEAIDDNEYLARVRIATNNLLSNGVRVICKAALNAMNLTRLDLSDNGIVENDAVYLKELIDHSESLQELNLSKNKILAEGIILISKALVSPCCSLQMLDLSWNHIRLDGARAIGKALEINTSLEKVNLAWNGLHKEGAVSIRNALRHNTSLKELDLTCNRFSELCIAELLKGLGENSSLEMLHIGQNHMTCKGALTFIETIRDNKSSGLKEIDLGYQVVDENFQAVYEEIQSERDIRVIHGSVHMVERKPLSSSDQGNEEKMLMHCNPLTVLMECMRLQNYRLLDMFNRLDTNNSKHIDLSELCDGMLKCGVPLQKHTMMKLLQKLDKDGNNCLDYKEIVDAHGIHQKLVRHYLQNGTKFEETEVGRVSMLLRKIMNKDLVMKKVKDDVREKDKKEQQTV